MMNDDSLLDALDAGLPILLCTEDGVTVDRGLLFLSDDGGAVEWELLKEDDESTDIIRHSIFLINIDAVILRDDSTISICCLITENSFSRSTMRSVLMFRCLDDIKSSPVAHALEALRAVAHLIDGDGTTNNAQTSKPFANRQGHVKPKAEERGRRAANGEWRRRKKRNHADFLLCGMNRSEHQRMCLIFSVTLIPLTILSFQYSLLWFITGSSFTAAVTGLLGWVTLEEEDQRVSLVDSNGKVIFAGFGRETEIQKAMEQIDHDRSTRRQSLEV